MQLQEAEVSSSALAEEPASRPRPLPATGSNHSAAAEVEGGSGSRGAGVRTNSHYDAQQHCRQEVGQLGWEEQLLWVCWGSFSERACP